MDGARIFAVLAAGSSSPLLPVWLVGLLLLPIYSACSADQWYLPALGYGLPMGLVVFALAEFDLAGFDLAEFDLAEFDLAEFVLFEFVLVEVGLVTSAACPPVVASFVPAVGWAE